jgi:acetyl esterase/lipase
MVFPFILKNMRLFYVALFFLIVSSCKSDLNLIIPADAPGMINDTPLTYEEKLDIPYGKDVLQNYDLYLPSKKNQRNPVIVLVHPGAWRIGDKKAVNFLVKILIDKRVNCAIVNTNYRLTSSPGITYVQQIQDINSLLNKVKNDAPSLGISSNFYLVGISAGGHLSMLYSNTGLGDKLAQGVAAVVPPVDLTSQRMREGDIGPDVKRLIGKPFTEAREEYYLASPVFFYHPRSKPTIVFFGAKDETVPLEQAETCKNFLITGRVNHEFHLYPNQNHNWDIWDETVNKIIAFAEKNL